MNVEEYKKLGIRELTFPSGLVVSITLPSAQSVLAIFSEKPNSQEMVKRMLEASKFSDGLEVEDIKDLDDYTYLASVLTDFFAKSASSSTEDSKQVEAKPASCVGSSSEDSKSTG
jgi:hypothetical protein